MSNLLCLLVIVHIKVIIHSLSHLRLIQRSPTPLATVTPTVGVIMQFSHCITFQRGSERADEPLPLSLIRILFITALCNLWNEHTPRWSPACYSLDYDTFMTENIYNLSLTALSTLMESSTGFLKRIGVFFPLWGVLQPSEVSCILVGLLSLNKIAMSTLQKNVVNVSHRAQQIVPAQFFHPVLFIVFNALELETDPDNPLPLTLPECFLHQKDIIQAALYQAMLWQQQALWIKSYSHMGWTHNLCNL